MMRVTFPIALFLATVLLPAAHADPAVPPTITPPDLSGLALPDIDREALVADIEALRSTLIRRKHDLAQLADDRKLDGKDALITAIMPGGLLYAGLKKLRYREAQDALAAVSADIAELTGDLLVLQAVPIPVAVAELPQ